MDRTAPSFHSTENATPAVLHALTVPFRAVSTFWSQVLKASELAEAAEKLYATSDTALVAKGLTRQGEIERIFSK